MRIGPSAAVKLTGDNGLCASEALAGERGPVDEQLVSKYTRLLA